MIKPVIIWLWTSCEYPSNLPVELHNVFTVHLIIYCTTALLSSAYRIYVYLVYIYSPDTHKHVNTRIRSQKLTFSDHYQQISRVQMWQDVLSCLPSWKHAFSGFPLAPPFPTPSQQVLFGLRFCGKCNYRSNMECWCFSVFRHHHNHRHDCTE